MRVIDRNGAAIRVGDPIVQRYPHREALRRDPFRGVVTAIEARPAERSWMVEYREDDTEHTRNGDQTTIEYDWHPPKRGEEER